MSQAVVAAAGFSSSPKRARATYWPKPGSTISSSPSTTIVPRSEHRLRRAGDLGALVEVVVRARVLRRRRDRDLLLGVEDDDVRVGADRDRALARVEAEQLRGVRREQLDHAVERDPAVAHAELRGSSAAGSRARARRSGSSRSRPCRSPSARPTRTRSGRSRSPTGRRCAPRSRARPGSPSRAAAACRRTSRPRSSAARGTCSRRRSTACRSRPRRSSRLLARARDRLDRLAARDVDDVERRAGDVRELDRAVRRLALRLGRARQRVVSAARCGLRRAPSSRARRSRRRSRRAPSRARRSRPRPASS